MTNVTLVIATATTQNANMSGVDTWHAFSNGVDTGLTVTLTGVYSDQSADGFDNFGGQVIIPDFPGGTTLSFKLDSSELGVSGLEGLTNEAGELVEWEIPDQDNYINTDLTTIYFDFIETYGCMDWRATNYDASANAPCVADPGNGVGAVEHGCCEYHDLTDKLMISEIHYEVRAADQKPASEWPDPYDDADFEDEEETWVFFEIYNRTDEVLSLKGLNITFGFLQDGWGYESLCGETEYLE